MMINEFLNYLKFERNRSDLTIKNYGEDLRAFKEFYGNLEGCHSWKSVDSDIIRDWMESMMDKGNNATSINRRLSALRSFYRFALARKLVDKDPVHGVTGPKKGRPLPQFLKENEMDRLLDAESWTESFEDMRDRTIIMTFYETGIRLSELIGLDDSMVDFSNRQLKVTGKRNKQRVIPFGEELLATLRDYMKCRDKEVNLQSEALFVTAKGQRMTSSQVREGVKRNLSKVCTLKKRTPHVLRHTFATAMLNNKAGIESVKKLLGHESLSTTEIYTHTTFEQLKREYYSAHPRA
ncbi:site-specific tyrosine recombinase/integron integrase [Segatella salivae]|uniref:Tyrosine recombinase XerC n=1 Tax=Segatella salivae F0493 TaxID=1395125 RepID=U2MSZ7_9BACT|nr:site-specific tyrosine recombinase/integron integrase [Segatella salivae]ERK02369.1 putative tyrosine recombinase XerC [Segatella salivae F0493]